VVVPGPRVGGSPVGTVGALGTGGAVVGCAGGAACAPADGAGALIVVAVPRATAVDLAGAGAGAGARLAVTLC
ncbi:hypothetical protein ABTX35_35425, partial [Streptomyces sp. NPDC096080]